MPSIELGLGQLQFEMPNAGAQYRAGLCLKLPGIALGWGQLDEPTVKTKSFRVEKEKWKMECKVKG